MSAIASPVGTSAEGPNTRGSRKSSTRRRQRVVSPAMAPETRLLTALDASAALARRVGHHVVVYTLHEGRAVQAGRFPAALAETLGSSGALEAVRRGEETVYVLSAAGRARLRRARASADPFGGQHGLRLPLAATAEASATLINAAESPLMWLYRRKGRTGAGMIGDAEFAAGERLRSDVTMAHLMPRLGADLERIGGSGVAIGLLPGEARVAARQRVERAMTAVGPEFSGLLLDICGFLKGLDQVERERLWPARSAKVVLVLALAALARHYGFANQACGPRRSKGVSMWGAADFRPEFSPEAGSQEPGAHPT